MLIVLGTRKIHKLPVVDADRLRTKKIHRLLETDADYLMDKDDTQQTASS